MAESCFFARICTYFMGTGCNHFAEELRQAARDQQDAHVLRHEVLSKILLGDQTPCNPTSAPLPMKKKRKKNA